MIWAVIPAAGHGSRFGGARPKQYWTLGGRTLIEHALEPLLAYPEMERVVIALSNDDTHFERLSVAKNPLVESTLGGDTRAHSVMAGLERLAALGAAEQDLVLVHDAARPCLRGEDLDKVIRRARRGDGALLAVPARDTLKQVDSASRHPESLGTLDRTAVWQAQTPQVFPLGRLRDALTRAQDVTDEASAIEQAGGSPALVEGHHDNIKVTWLEDLALAEASLRSQGRWSTEAAA